MKKLILTSMFATVGVFAQSGNTQATPNNPTAAPATQAPAQTQPKHKHKKNAKTNNGTTANQVPAGSSNAKPNPSGSVQKPQ